MAAYPNAAVGLQFAALCCIGSSSINLLLLSTHNGSVAATSSDGIYGTMLGTLMEGGFLVMAEAAVAQSS